MANGPEGYAVSMSDVEGSIESTAAKELTINLHGLLNGEFSDLNVVIDDVGRNTEGGGPAEIILSRAADQLAFSGRLKTSRGLDSGVMGVVGELHERLCW